MNNVPFFQDDLSKVPSLETESSKTKNKAKPLKSSVWGFVPAVCRGFFRKFRIVKRVKKTKKSEQPILIMLAAVFVACAFSFFVGIVFNNYFSQEFADYLEKLKIASFGQFQGTTAGQEQVVEQVCAPRLTREEAVIKAVKEVSPAVVSIVVTKDLPVVEEYYVNPLEDFFGPNGPGVKIPQYRQKGTEKKEIGGGTGFIISEDGMILTNKHVVLDKEADYTVLTNDGKKFPAKVLARDPVQDLAVLKIEREKEIAEEGELSVFSFPVVQLGDSSRLQIGQTVIAIGNALGEFRNTVSVGVISGLGRTITASGGGLVETLEDVVQTDAAINRGNSGGPLLNLEGEVIGINTAIAMDAQSIGFAIPVDKAKRNIEQIKKTGKIVYPFLGVYYALITDALKEKYDLPVDYGAWVGRKNDGQEVETAIFSGSPAEKAGILKDDIILEFNKEKITINNSLAKIIQNYEPGEAVSLKILRSGEELFLEEVILDERGE